MTNPKTRHIMEQINGLVDGFSIAIADLATENNELKEKLREQTNLVTLLRRDNAKAMMGKIDENQWFAKVTYSREDIEYYLNDNNGHVPDEIMSAIMGELSEWLFNSFNALEDAVNGTASQCSDCAQVYLLKEGHECPCPDVDADDAEEHGLIEDGDEECTECGEELIWKGNSLICSNCSDNQKYSNSMIWGD